MLLAVEGGGFFSSSASGYSKGLTLLFLGQRSEEKPMRVTPWNQYQLVDQGTDPDLQVQLASAKNGAVRGCASFVCFGRTAAGLESPSPLKVGPIQQQEISPEPLVFDESKDETESADLFVDDDRNRKISLKSSLKKPWNAIQPSNTCGGEHEESFEKHKTVDSQMERRKVQWTDTSGGELYEIREFEMSDDDSEFDHGNERTCSCTIM